MEKVRVVLCGVGSVGSSIAKFLLQKEGVEIAGAIDVAEEKVEKDLGEVLGIGKRLGVAVSNDPDAVLSRVKADIMVHATASFLKQVYPQIAKALEHGVNVVSTCEELAYPYTTEPELARKLDELAKENGVTVLGTGINPGFLMDTLVITLTSVCQKIERIRATRTINAATRRGPFQKKIGAGLLINEFRNRIERKIITGHVGLKESISMIADALGWKLDRIEVDPVEPVVAKAHGKVAGLKQCARGLKEGKEVITLDFQAYMDAEEYDSITIEGLPNIHMKIAPCIHGDIGTVAMIVNSIPKVINAQPGLVTMKDLPIPSAALNDMRKYIHQ